MTKYEEQVRLAGIDLRMGTTWRHPDVEKFRAEGEPAASVMLPPEELARYRAAFPVRAAEEDVEFTLLAYAAGDALLDFDRCVFHGAAFLWREKVWIFSAPPGTGKTTQYALWKHCFGDEIRMLNGDKPILEKGSDGAIRVHPSPWCGKERMSNMLTGELGGIICLVQGAENTVSLLSPAEAVAPLYSQFIFLSHTPDAAGKVLAFEEHLLSSVPVWRLINRGDIASAQMTHDAIIAWEENRK